MHARTLSKTTAGTTTKSSGKRDDVRSVRLASTDAAQALTRAKNAFGREGFGLIAEIDLRDTLQRTLDKDVGPYWVLEMCNPDEVDRAFATTRNAGLLVPCKVAVWQEGKDAVVAVLRPEVAAGGAGDDRLTTIAREAERHIERALVYLDAPERELPITD